MSDEPLEISPAALKHLLDAGASLRIIDVREPFEYETARLGVGELIPMQTIPAHLNELAADPTPMVILCHHGVRSLQVVQFLRHHGIPRCRSLAGGIDQWSCEIDPTVPRY